MTIEERFEKLNEAVMAAEYLFEQEAVNAEAAEMTEPGPRFASASS